MDLRTCDICPRSCHVDRIAGQLGVCGQGADVVVARAALHFWEEPPISGVAGSGTVFFSGCPLKCVYCQNVSISRGLTGKAVSIERLAEIFLEQQERGALNINLVTPTHFAPHIAEAIALARSHGLRIPIVYNTSGYERVETLLALEELVDIYLTDFKYASSELAQRYSSAPDYPAAAEAALDEMMRQVPACTYAEDGHMTRGVIVRHLLLPGQLADSFAVIRLLASKPYATQLVLSLMSQYTPMEGIAEAFPELGTVVERSDYEALIDYAYAYGFEDVFTQDEGADDDSFIPPFDCTGV